MLSSAPRKVLPFKFIAIDEWQWDGAMKRRPPLSIGKCDQNWRQTMNAADDNGGLDLAKIIIPASRT